MRLIDADEYEKRIKPYDTEDVMDKALYNFAHEKLITTPTAQPEIIDIAKTTMAMAKTADMVAVVRCKDCKHGMYDVMCKFYWCHGVAHSANWFCADAERRTDG